MSKILLIHNTLAPYRQPLFKHMSSISKIDFCILEKDLGYRKWENEININFDFFYAKTRYVNVLSKKICWSIKISNIKTYDVIIMPDDKAYLLPLFKIKKSLNQNQKIIFWTANNKHSLFHINSIFNFCLKKIFNLIRSYCFYDSSSYFWAYGKFCEKYLINRFNIKKNKIFIGLQGYPKENIHFNFKKINFKDRFKSKSIVFIGYPSKRKNLGFFAKTLFKINKNNFDLHCIGPLPKKKIKGVKYHGYLNGEQKFDKLNGFSYAVLPSISDPWGWVVNECMSIGLPVLVSEGVMAKEMVAEKLTFNLNEKDLAQTIRFINEISFETYQKLSKQCMETSNYHSLDKTKRSYKKLLDEVR